MNDDRSMNWMNWIIGATAFIKVVLAELTLIPMYKLVSKINWQDRFVRKVYKTLPIKKIIIVLAIIMAVLGMAVSAGASAAVDITDSSLPSIVSDSFNNHDGVISSEGPYLYYADYNYENEVLAYRQVSTSKGIMYLRYEMNSDGVFIPIEGIFENGDILKFDFSKFDIEIEDGKPKRYGRVNDENGREWVTILEVHPVDREIQLISLSELVSRRNELQTTKQRDNTNKDVDSSESNGKTFENIPGFNLSFNLLILLIVVEMLRKR